MNVPDDVTAARLVASGVPEDAALLRDSSRLRRFAAELDRFSGFGYGAATQRRFMVTPHPQLSESPADRLRRAGSEDEVVAALRHTLSQIATR